MLIEILQFIFGLVLLVGGASMLVSGSSRLATLFGVPQVLVGLTIVAWGTSAPEFFVSMQAIVQGSSDLVLGNVIGSNLANIGLILGVAVLIMSPKIDRRLMRFDIPVLLLGTIILAVLARDGWLDRLDGLILLLAFLIITARILATAKINDREDGDNVELDATGVVRPRLSQRGRLVSSLLVLIGAVGLSFGGRFIVEAAVNIAEALNVSETIIGLTMVAIGTSLPEMATTIVAALRRESGIAVGNVIGSNLFNTLAVTGPVALFRPVAVSGQIAQRELPIMFAFTLLMTLLVIGRREITKFAGLLLLLVYLGIMIWWVVL